MIELPDRAARERLAPLLGASRDILLTACLQGYAGRAAISQSGRSAALLTGDFAFLAGDPDIAALRWLSENKPGLLIISGASGWLSLAQSMGRAWEKSIRYAFDTPESWDIARLTALTQALPAGFTLHPMDGALYARCRQVQQLSDLCGCDGDEAAFLRTVWALSPCMGRGLPAARRPMPGMMRGSRWKSTPCRPSAARAWLRPAGRR